jgi:hypothetical protein
VNRRTAARRPGLLRHSLDAPGLAAHERQLGPLRRQLDGSGAADPSRGSCEQHERHVADLNSENAQIRNSGPTAVKLDPALWEQAPEA